MAGHVMRDSIFLIPAFPCLRHAVGLIERRIEAGSNVIIVVFREDLHRFFLPLQGLGIRVDLVNCDINLICRTPLRLWRERNEMFNLFEDLWGDICDAEVFCYGTSISAPAIAAVAFLSAKNTVWYNPVFEGRYTDTTFFGSCCRSLRQRARGALFSWLLRAPVQMYRDWSPVPVLSESFIRRRFRQQHDPQMEPRGRVTDLLRVADDAEVIWLYTDFPRYYSYSEAEAAAFHSAMTNIVQTVTTSLHGAGQAVKGHPTYGEPYPSYFSRMRPIPPSLPVEFISFSKLHLVLADASMAMSYFLRRPEIKVVSLLELLPNPQGRREELRKYLVERVEGSRAAITPATLQELEQVCRGLPNKLPCTATSPSQ